MTARPENQNPPQTAAGQSWGAIIGDPYGKLTQDEVADRIRKLCNVLRETVGIMDAFRIMDGLPGMSPEESLMARVAYRNINEMLDHVMPEWDAVCKAIYEANKTGPYTACEIDRTQRDRCYACKDTGGKPPSKYAEPQGSKERVEEQLRIALDGHPKSELWGEHGLIAATMRCVEAIREIEDLVATDHETKEAFIQHVRGIFSLPNAKHIRPEPEANQ